MPLNPLQLLELARRTPQALVQGHNRAMQFLDSPTQQTQAVMDLNRISAQRRADPLSHPDTVIIGYEPDFKTGQVVPILARKEFREFGVPGPDGVAPPVFYARRFKDFNPQTGEPHFTDEEYVEDVETGEYYPSRDTEPKSQQVLNKALGKRAFEESRKPR